MNCTMSNEGWHCISRCFFVPNRGNYENVKKLGLPYVRVSPGMSSFCTSVPAGF